MCDLWSQWTGIFLHAWQAMTGVLPPVADKVFWDGASKFRPLICPCPNSGILQVKALADIYQIKQSIGVSP